ncbi:hypothetical protein [Staphylococcus succinus]|uniref:hypothetical protein n=1 Tax=Staphylococcus succinus TaxID=61015 RepID=UPI000E6A7134|nr:hypothetical protein [Staphylococcus succinus]RIN27738.1 hypothetical protein BU067_01645 [Staphylococcus succinus]
MKSEYSIYHDEAFHDRKVTSKGKTYMNIENKDSSSYFYLIHLGFKNNEIDKYTSQYLQLESSYKKKLGLCDEQELKGDILKKRWFRYGIKTMNKEQVDFYTNYMKLIDKDVIISISIINQFELVFKNVFRGINTMILGHKEGSKMYYAFSKFLYLNKSEELLNLLFDIENNKVAIKQEIKSIANSVIIRNKEIAHKFTETPIAEQLLQFIENEEDICNDEKYDMDYAWSFQGISLLLDELEISKKVCELYIDGEEGFEKIIEMLQSKYYIVDGLDSKKSIGNRMSDMFIRLISAIIHSLEDQLINVGKTNKKEKHDLSEEWFKLTEKQYDLYIVIADIFNQREYIKGTLHISISSDAAFIFFMLLNYFVSFKDFNEYQKVSASEHANYFIGNSLIAFSKLLDDI